MDMSECPRESPQFTDFTVLAGDWNSKYGWNTHVGWAVSASSSYDTSPTGRVAYKLFNKTRGENDRWVSGLITTDSEGNIVGSEEWVRIDFPEPIIVSSYLMAPWGSGTIQAPARWTLEAYDGSAWVSIGEEVSVASWTTIDPNS
jgi:hypothetical protein